MPETLKEMPKINRPGRKPKYPYGEWFAQAKKEPIGLLEGKDFDCAVTTMQHNLYRQGKAQNLDVHTVIIDNGIALQIGSPSSSKKSKTERGTAKK